MAKIRNIQIKSLNKTKDHEGMDIYSGNIYYNNKKLGYWTQDYMNGPDRYDFDESELEDVAKEYAKTDAVKPIFKKIYNLDCLLDDLIRLMDHEKMYKAAIKQDFLSLIIVTDRYHVFGLMTCYATKEQNLKNCKKDIDELKAKCFKNETPQVLVYTCKEDFVIE